MPQSVVKPNGLTASEGAVGTAILETPKATPSVHEVLPNAAAAKNADNESSSKSSESENGYEVIGSESGAESANENAPLPAFFGSYSSEERHMMFPEMRSASAQEVIIGADNRTRINPTTAYPWRAICALKITARNGQRYVGTGWLIGPRTVITAGHCVFMHDAGGWAASIEVIPAMNDNSRPYGSAVSSDLRSVTGWTSSRNRDNDYGAIILPANKRLGDTVGYFGFATRNDATLQNAALNLSGYPNDKGANQQWFMAQRPSNVGSRVLTYQIDTYGGQSGAPVWLLENGNRYGVGIHTNGASSGNSATRIVQAVYNNMVNWKAQGA